MDEVIVVSALIGVSVGSVIWMAIRSRTPAASPNPPQVGSEPGRAAPTAARREKAGERRR